MGNTASGSLSELPQPSAEHETISLICIPGCVRNFCHHCFGVGKQEVTVEEEDDVFSEVCESLA